METAPVALEGTPCAKAEHETLARELAVHGNALAAYRRTYPDCAPESAKSNAYRLAKHPDVARRVAELREEHRKRLLEKTADLDALVSNLALGKAAELFDEDGNPIPVQEWPEHVKAAIAGIELEVTHNDDGERVTRYKLKFPDPLAAARLLAQLRGQLVNRTDVTSAGRPLAPVVDPQALPADLERELRRRLLPGSMEPPIDGEATVLDDGSDLIGEEGIDLIGGLPEGSDLL